MKWLLSELAVLAVSVFLIVPLLIVMLACVPFYAAWACFVDDDGLEEL